MQALHEKLATVRKSHQWNKSLMAEKLATSRQRYQRLEEAKAEFTDKDWLSLLENTPAPGLFDLQFQRGQLGPQTKTSKAATHGLANFFLHEAQVLLGEDRFNQFCAEHGLALDAFHARLQHVSYRLIFNLVEQVIKSGQWHYPYAQNQLAHKLINSPLFWGRHFRAFELLSREQRLETCLWEWQRTSYEFEISHQKRTFSKRFEWLVEISPRRMQLQEEILEFPLAQDFFVEFLSSALEALLDEPCIRHNEVKEAKWSIQLICMNA